MRRALERAVEAAALLPGECAVVFHAHDRGELGRLLGERESADGAPAAVFIVPGGYEGKVRLRALIDEAAAMLVPGGSLIVVSHARKGAGALARMAEEALGNCEVVARGWGGMRVLRAVKEGEPRPAAPPVPDEIEADIGGRRFHFGTEPGVFSRERLDPGTRLLIESIDVAGARTVLDLGCGYGPIGIAVGAAARDAIVTMIDIDARAVALARANAQRNDVVAEALVADGPAALARRFDLILSHFPLHAPKGERERLVREARYALAPGGRFCAVVLREYDLAPVMERELAGVERVAEDDRYVVVCGTASRTPG
jgi:16S rRNA (guanine1207-N2)-methyltransferase